MTSKTGKSTQRSGKTENSTTKMHNKTVSKSGKSTKKMHHETVSKSGKLTKYVETKTIPKTGKSTQRSGKTSKTENSTNKMHNETVSTSGKFYANPFYVAKAQACKFVETKTVSKTGKSTHICEKTSKTENSTNKTCNETVSKSGKFYANPCYVAKARACKLVETKTVSKTGKYTQRSGKTSKSENSTTKMHNKTVSKSEKFTKCVAKARANKLVETNTVSKTGKSFQKSERWADWIAKSDSTQQGSPQPTQGESSNCETEWENLDQDFGTEELEEGECNLLQEIHGQITETFRKDHEI